MQETGNNIKPTNKILSIRLSSNGQYFSVADDNSEIVSVILDTNQMVLVPTEAFKPELAKSYLDINSYSPTPQQCVVLSTPVDDIIAIMAWDSGQINDLKNQFADRLHFTSPILNNIKNKERDSMQINRCSKNVYITLYNENLEFAECLPYESIADILYYTETLKSQFGLDKRTIYICGDDAKLLADQLKHYYRKVVLRDNI